MFRISRTTFWYTVALLTVFVLFNWKLLLTNQFTWTYGLDSIEGPYSWFSFWAKTIKQGILPIWDPYTWAGRPFVEEMQTAVFYPLNVLLLLIPFHADGTYARLYFDAFLLLGHLLGLFFMFALMREFQVSRFTSFIASICFSLAGIASNILLWADVLHTAMWLPLIMLFLLRTLRRTDSREVRLNASLTGLFFGVSILAGRLHFVILYGLLIVVVVLFYAGIAQDKPDNPTALRRYWLRTSVLILVILGVGACAGAVQLLPSHEYSSHSIRTLGAIALPTTQKIPYDYMKGDMLYPYAWLGVLFPYGFNGTLGTGEVWIPYIGVLPFAFALIGVWKTWNNLWTRFFAGLTAFCFIYSLSWMSIFHGALYAIVPYLYLEREATRFILLAHFGLIILAAFGLEFFLTNSTVLPTWISLKRILKIVLLSFLVLSVVCAVFNPFSSIVNLWVYFAILLIIITSGLLLYLVGKPVSSWGHVIIVMLLLFDLNAYNWRVASKLELEKSNPEYWQELNNCRDVVAFFKRQPGPFRVQTVEPTHPNIGDIFGVPTTTAFAATWLSEFDPFSAHQEMLNNRYILRPSSAADPGPVYQDAHWKVYENPNAYPHAWLVHETRVERSNPAIADHIKYSDVDFHRVALLSAPLREAIEPQPAEGHTQISFSDYKPTKVGLSVTSPSSALLVMSEIYYPGWHATLNGRPTEIYKVNGGLRGIVVPRGESVITMSYTPLTIYVGGVITILTFLLILAYAALVRISHEHEPNQSPEHNAGFKYQKQFGN
jgi:hypothetical protein